MRKLKMVENHKIKGKTFAENDLDVIFARAHCLGVGNHETIFLLSTIQM